MSTALKIRKQRSKSLVASIVELVIIVAVALGLALAIQAWVVKPYRIPSGSMEPTLKVGQRVLVNRIGLDFGGPSVGQIVVFHPPEGADNERCGRAVGPGEACSQAIEKKSNVEDASCVLLSVSSCTDITLASDEFFKALTVSLPKAGIIVLMA